MESGDLDSSGQLELNATKEAAWDEALQSVLAAARRTAAELRESNKSAVWKLRLAAALRRKTTATNRWLGINLHLGARTGWCPAELGSSRHPGIEGPDP
jgi:hypothetical protein